MNTLTDPVHLSNLKKFGESPAHYLASIGTDEDKLAYRIGRLTHLLLLGVQPGVKWDVYDGKRQGKAWETFRDERPGTDIFTVKEKALCLAMARAVEAHPIAFPLLKGEFELPVEWTGENGRRCATRGIDCLNRADRYTLELKTAVSSEPVRFNRDAIRMGYHAQGAWFKEAAASIGADVTRHFVVAVEKKAPHVVTVFCVTDRALVEGQKLCRMWMGQLKGCEEAVKSGLAPLTAFPGYAQYIVDLDTRDEAAAALAEDGDEDELEFEEDGEAA